MNREQYRVLMQAVRSLEAQFKSLTEFLLRIAPTQQATNSESAPCAHPRASRWTDPHGNGTGWYMLGVGDRLRYGDEVRMYGVHDDWVPVGCDFGEKLTQASFRSALYRRPMALYRLEARR